MNEIRQTFNEEQYKSRSATKIYSSRQIKITGLLGGPIVAAYFLTENFKVFGDYGNVRRTWLYTGAMMILFVVFITLFPGSGRAIPLAFPLLLASTVNIYTRKYQDNKIGAHLENGGEVYSWKRTWFVIVVGTVLGLILLILLRVILNHVLSTLRPN